MLQKERQILETLYQAAIKAVIPYNSVKEFLDTHKHRFTNKALYVIAFGKAACSMVLAAEEFFGPDRIIDGIAITKYGHISEPSPQKVKVFEAAHPIPDEKGLKATEKVIQLARRLNEDALCLCLISGGGSALLVCPAQGLSLQDKQNTTDLLLRAGADIYELNTVRKHISSVKGGRLMELLFPSEVLSLILSDVLGDRLDMIASGPTVPDPTTYVDAYNVLKKYSLLEEIPKSVENHIRKGTEGKIPETPDKNSIVFQKTENYIIGNLHKALKAAKVEAEKMGFRTRIITEKLSGEAREAARFLAAMAKQTSEPMILLSGGETTVTVKGNGKGGRNTELALAFAIEIKDHPGIYLLSAGTDGTDGPTDAAGAFVDSHTYDNAVKKGYIPEKFLEENDSYTFFLKTNGLYKPGPTGTNVMDIQIILVK